MTSTFFDAHSRQPVGHARPASTPGPGDADLAQLIPRRPLYRPADAAELCGISVDRVTDHIATRPRLFPKKHWARRHEWDADEFVKVIVVLCALSTRAAARIQERLEGLMAK